jgi:MFS transporter, DHA2 family, multidrug resistance protein
VNDLTAPLRGAKLFALTMFISLATFMEVLDMTIVNVSIPSIAGTLGVSPNEGTWTISSYTLAAACLQPLTGWLGRRFGEIKVFTGCATLFVASSAFCGFATSMPMLITSRLVQGAVSGPMVPMAQAILMRNYPPEKRGMAMAIWSMVVFIAPVCGPLLGGWITDNMSWPWIFLINIPIGVVCIFGTGFITRGRDTKVVKSPVDFTGLLLLIAGVGSLQFVLDNGNSYDWFDSPLILFGSGIAAVCLTVLIAWELTDRHPVLDLHLFKHHNFNIGVIALCVGFSAFFAGLVLQPLWLQTTVGYTAFQAGLISVPVGLAGVFIMPLIGTFLPKLEKRFTATCGLLIIAAVIYWMSLLNADATLWDFMGPRALQGFGMPLFFLSLQQIMFSDVQDHELAAAAGLSNFCRTIAMSMTTALAVYGWTSRTEFHAGMLASQVTDSPRWSDWTHSLAAAGLGDSGAGAFGMTQHVLQAQATTMGLNDVLLGCALLVLTLVPVVWAARPPFSSKGPPAH